MLRSRRVAAAASAAIALALATLGLHAPVTSASHEVVTADFSAVGGRWNADLLGVNHGPIHVVNSGESFRYRSNPPNWIDLSDQYRAAGVKWVRTDEIASGDITFIFPHGPAADPDNPANYYFEDVDYYLKKAIEAGSQIIFRVGYSDNNSLGYIVPPLSNERYAKIALNILRHFNDGWGNGHHFGVKHVELWNEPDLVSQAGASAVTWVGTGTQFAELYRVFSTTVKAHDPTIQVGGFGAAYRLETEFSRQFLSEVKRTGAPLDFFSWHHYAPAPVVVRDEARKVRQVLDSYGHTSTRSVLTEWASSIGQYDSVAEASFVMGTFAMLQQGEDGPNRLVDIATYYTGSPFVLTGSNSDWGMFDPTPDAPPRKNYWAAQQYSWLSTQTPLRAAAASPDGMLPAMAGVSEDGRTAHVVVNTLGAPRDSLVFELRGLSMPSYTVEVLAVDSAHDNTPLMPTATVETPNGTARIDVPAVETPSVVLLRLTASA